MASSSPRPGSTILITGGNGSLGSTIAIQIAKSQPGKHHLILTARKLDDARTIETSATLRTLNASFEFLTLDLSSLENIKHFAAKLEGRILTGEIPKFDGGGVVLSAAMLTFVKDSRTKDGWSEMYGINVLAQHLITRELLPVLGGALVVNITSTTHNIGTVDYFSSETNRKRKDTDNAREQGTLGLGEAMKRYGSSKLLFAMSAYALQRRLDSVSSGSDFSETF
jgi:NAD(P)-dependent dehydrogenase (short-subunit alcohol dehydrogenase family)